MLSFHFPYLCLECSFLVGNPHTISALFLKQLIAQSIVAVNLIVPIIWNCEMFRVNVFNLQLRNTLPLSCKIIWLCLSGKCLSLFTIPTSMILFKWMNNTFMPETERNRICKSKKKPRQECACVRYLMHDDWSFISFAPLRALSVCIAAAKWTLDTKDVHGKRVGGERWGVHFWAQAQPCRHLLQKDFTLD